MSIFRADLKHQLISSRQSKVSRRRVWRGGIRTSHFPKVATVRTTVSQGAQGAERNFPQKPKVFPRCRFLPWNSPGVSPQKVRRRFQDSSRDCQLARERTLCLLILNICGDCLYRLTRLVQKKFVTRTQGSRGLNIGRQWLRDR